MTFNKQSTQPSDVICAFPVTFRKPDKEPVSVVWRGEDHDEFKEDIICLRQRRRLRSNSPRPSTAKPLLSNRSNQVEIVFRNATSNCRYICVIHICVYTRIRYIPIKTTVYCTHYNRWATHPKRDSRGTEFRGKPSCGHQTNGQNHAGADTLFDRTKSVSFRPEWRPSIRYAGRYLSGRTAGFYRAQLFPFTFFQNE